MATVALSGIITPSNVVTAASTTTLTNKTLTAPTIASANLTTALTLAGAAGTNGQVLTSAGSGMPTWTTISSSPTLVRSARTSNTILGTADVSTLIDITSGTFTQTFTASATLGSGWFCYIRNSGTGDITLNPNASETIDGLTDYIMYPNECRLVQCTGTAFFTLVVDPFYREFTASGTFTKPPGYSLFGGLLWAGGNSGQRTNNASTISRGGPGGGCSDFLMASYLVGATETITVGAGGAAVTGVAAPNQGGATSLGTLIAISISVSSAHVGTSVLNGLGANGGDATTKAGNVVGNYEGIGSFSGAVAATTFGGAGTDSSAANNSGGSLYGGAAGGSIDGAASSVNPGVSKFGGNGGAASSASSGTAGTAPGGGGGATQTGASSGAGARGEVRIWGIA